jgi:signal transduction histidine kinase
MEPGYLHAEIFDAVGDPLVVMDEAGGVHAANAAAIRVFEFAGETPARARPVRLALDVRALAELVALRRKVEGVPVTDRTGRITGVLVDVAPLASRRGALLHFRARTESLSRELWTDDAVATVAHEFRNPLTAMRTALNLLAAGEAGPLVPDQLRFVDAVQRGVGRLSRIVDGYLDLERVRAGVLAMERGEQNVRALVEGILADLALCHPALGSRVGVNVAAEVGGVYADPDRIAQVVLNLVYNAARFTPEGKKLSLRAITAGREALDDPLRVLPYELLGEPRFVCIEVEDEGIGMSADVLAHVFERYREDPRGAGRPETGAHLGLHIARALVDAHDGWLRIESRLGEGTTARVFLPADPATSRLVGRLRRAEEMVERACAARRAVSVALMADEAIRAAGEAPASWPREWVLNPVTNPSGPVAVWVMRDGLALRVSIVGDTPAGRIEEGAGPSAIGACGIEGRMTFSGALRAAAASLLENKDNRAVRAVSGLETARE